MTQLQANPEVVAALLARYTFATYNDLAAAQAELSAGVRLSMEHTQAYQIPMDQKLPEEVERTSAAPYVHPYNIAAALVSVCSSGAKLGGGNLPVDPTLQVYNTASGAWQPVAGSQVPTVELTIAAPPQAIPAAPPPPPAPAPAAVPPPPPPAGDLASLVGAALDAPATGAQGGFEAVAAPSAVPATPVVPAAASAPQAPAPATTIEGLDRQGAFENPPTAPGGPDNRTVNGTAPLATTAEGVAGPTQVTLEQAIAEAKAAPPAPTAEVAGLPDPSVTAPRSSAAGRPAKSPFERTVEPRNKVASPPFWWGFLRHSAQRLFTETPPNAVSNESSGSGPVQAYALLLTLAQELLRSADGEVTVAELRTWLREVETGILALPSAKAIYQLVDVLCTEDNKAE